MGSALGSVGFLPTMLAIPIVAALDDGRYHWSHVPWWGCLVGYAVFSIGFVGVTWATSVNKFFEPIVRIQTDRGHKVIDIGPYAIIRHPGYVFVYLSSRGHSPGSRLVVGFDSCDFCSALGSSNDLGGSDSSE